MFHCQDIHQRSTHRVEPSCEVIRKQGRQASEQQQKAQFSVCYCRACLLVVAIQFKLYLMILARLVKV